MGGSLELKEAIKEAKRCLGCSHPQCRAGCPIGNDIPGFIKAVANGNIGRAAEILAERTNLPAICGRICPHELQCESHCLLGRKNAGIKIGAIEKFVADFVAEMDLHNLKPIARNKGKVAVIGSGPAGLTVAGDLAKAGFSLTVYESQPEPGGVLMYGIPEFRLPKYIVRREIDKLSKLGVSFKTNVMVGFDLTIDKMFSDGFDAICISTGNSLPKALEIPGENLPGVVPAIYFLQMVALAETSRIAPWVIPVKQGDNVIVLGGGNVAIDAARTAKRLGAATVTIALRGTIEKTKILKSEIEAAQSEGTVFRENFVVSGLTGTERIEAVEFNAGKVSLKANKVLVAIGQRPAARIVSTTTGISVDEKGFVITRDYPAGMTTRAGVFAGGDVVNGPATVVLSMRHAKKVAAGIASYVEAKKLMEVCERQPVSVTTC